MGLLGRSPVRVLELFSMPLVAVKVFDLLIYVAPLGADSLDVVESSYWYGLLAMCCFVPLVDWKWPRRISYRVFIRRLLAPSVVWILALFVKILLCSKAVENRARGWLPEGDILPEGNSTPEIESQLQRAAHSHVEDAGPPEPQPDHETTPQAARPKVATSTIETMPVQVQHLSSGLSHPLPDQVVPPQAVALKEMIGTTEAMPVQVQHLSSSLPDSSPARDLSQQASQDVTSASVKTQQQRPAQAKTRRNRTKVPFKAAEGDAPPNSLQFATSGITVAVRITRTGNSAQLARYDVAGNAIVSGPFDDSEGDRREFHHVFPAETDNNTLNRALHPLYHHFMSAPDSMSAILMDGYSGTGKSHTLCDQQDSIVMQLAAFLFPVSDTAREEPVRLAALQVVPGNGKEELDFLDLGATSAERATQTRGVPWSMSKQYVARDRQALTALLRAAKARRKRESTMNNGQSSRSHMLFAFTIEFPGDRYSTLLLADLAGNERHEGDEWDAERKKEGRGINVSRSSIEHNLKEVQKDHSHVLSSSKIMSLMAPCFQQANVVLMLSHVSEEKKYKEMGLHTLEFASDVFRGRRKGVPTLPRGVLQLAAEDGEVVPR